MNAIQCRVIWCMDPTSLNLQHENVTNKLEVLFSVLAAPSPACRFRVDYTASYAE